LLVLQLQAAFRQRRNSTSEFINYSRGMDNSRQFDPEDVLAGLTPKPARAFGAGEPGFPKNSNAAAHWTEKCIARHYLLGAIEAQR